MKQNRKKLLLIVSVIVLLAGIIMISIKGFNFDLKYQNTKQIHIHLGKGFALSDMKQIVKDVFKNEPVMVQKVEVFEDAVSITSKEITDDQKKELVVKINEKYAAEVNEEDLELVDISHIRGRDLIKPYVIPFAIATVIILVYMMARYHASGVVKVVLKTIAIVGASQLLLFSIMAITRIPLGRLTIPLVLCVYVLSLTGAVNYFEKK